MCNGLEALRGFCMEPDVAENGLLLKLLEGEKLVCS